MTKQISPYIIKKDKNGSEYTIDNPEYQKLKQNKKYKFFLEKSGIPEFYWKIEFENYACGKESKEFKKIVYYAQNCHKEKFKHVSLYLYGRNNTQKSALMYNIGKQAIKNGMKVKSILANTLISNLLKVQGYGNDEDIQNKIKEVKESDLILIDDVGDINKSTYWTKSKNLVISEWDGFLREIFADDKKVVMTSNFDPTIFKQDFSESLYELIDRNCMSIQLIHSVKSIRKNSIDKIFEDIE